MDTRQAFYENSYLLYLATPSYAFPLRRWFNLRVIWDREIKTMRILIDGIEKKSRTTSLANVDIQDQSQHQTFEVGYRKGVSSYFYKGYIQNFIFYNGPIYNATKAKLQL